MSRMDKIAEKANNLYNKVTRTRQESMELLVELGDLLSKKKAENPGSFYKWVETNCRFSTKLASHYIRIANFKKLPKYKKENSARAILRKESKPLTIENAIREETKTEIQIIPIIEDRKLSEKDMKMFRIEYFNILEHVYDLGKKDKILTMDYKRKTFEALCKRAKIQ